MSGQVEKSFQKWRLELQLREPILHENAISGKVGSLTLAHGGERCIWMKLEGVLELDELDEVQKAMRS
jgi:hypothetical protein